MSTVKKAKLSQEVESALTLSEKFFDQFQIGFAVFDHDLRLHRYNQTGLNLLKQHSPLPVEQIKRGVRLLDLLPQAAPLEPLFTQAKARKMVRRQTFDLGQENLPALWDLALIPFQENFKNYIGLMVNDVIQPETNLAKLEEQASFHTKELNALQTISRNLVSMERAPLLDLILRQLGQVVEYHKAIIWKADNQHLTILASEGLLAEELEKNWTIRYKDEPALQQIVNRQETLIISDIEANTAQSQMFRNWYGPPTRSLRTWLGAPVMFKNRFMGLLTLHHQEPHAYNPEQARVVQTFADYIAMALENDRLYHQERHIAVLEERNRLARELHDNVAQALGYLNLQMSVSQELLDQGQIEPTQTKLQELKRVVNEIYTDVREEIFNLRGPDPYDKNFLDTVRDYLIKYRTFYELDVEMIIEDDKDLFQFRMDVGTQIIRIIQEALINVRKHSGVDHAILRFKQEDDQIRISIEDSGRGFDLESMDRTGKSGFGLKIMAERAESVGGRLELETRPGGGVRVIIWLPLAQTRL